MKTWLINKANITFKSRLHIEAGAVGCQIWLLASSHLGGKRLKKKHEGRAYLLPYFVAAISHPHLGSHLAAFYNTGSNYLFRF